MVHFNGWNRCYWMPITARMTPETDDARISDTSVVKAYIIK